MNEIMLTDFVKQAEEAFSSTLSIPINVPCGTCVACCTQEVSLEKDEQMLLQRDKLRPSNNGYCEMMINRKCEIYDFRPRQCQIFDCRSDFITKALGYKPNITPTIEHHVIIDDEALLFKLVMTSKEVIEIIKANDNLRISTWKATVLGYKQWYANFRRSFGY